MQKAYYKVEWTFLKQVIEIFGFSEWWVNRIIFCVQSTSFSVMLNGNPFGYFRPSRGLHQGDPLSLNVFLMCSEVLTLKLQEEQSKNEYEGATTDK